MERVRPHNERIVFRNKFAPGRAAAGGQPVRSRPAADDNEMLRFELLQIVHGIYIASTHTCVTTQLAT